MGKRGGGRGGSNTRFTGRRGGSSKRTGGTANQGDAGDVVLDRTDDGTAAQERYEEVAAMDEVDEKLGFWRFESGKVDGEEKIGWLVNMHQVRVLVHVNVWTRWLITRVCQTLLKSDSHAGGLAAVDYYFIQEDGGMFKATVAFEPYFFVVCKVRSFYSCLLHLPLLTFFAL
jgi:DNA polymerase epsilon subunit 1